MAEEKLSIYEFGRRLIESCDLDPVYCLLWHSGFDKWTMQKWLLAYFCFYHVGTASWITETDTEAEYWGRMETAVGSKDYPRSPERRHYRGDNAKKSVAWLKQRGVGGLMGPLLCRAWTVEQLIKYVKEWEQFGPWIAFKVADMIERLGLASVKFDAAAMLLFDSPKEGAYRMRSTYNPAFKFPVEDRTVIDWAIEGILLKLQDLKAPPRYERYINEQEAETVLCKWNSYMSGHYELGEDIASCRRGLLRFARTRTSQRLIEAGRKGGLWT